MSLARTRGAVGIELGAADLGLRRLAAATAAGDDQGLSADGGVCQMVSGAINSKTVDLTVVDFKRWAPPRLDECRFASYYAKVKDEYGLSFTSDEIDYYKKLQKDGCALRDRVITKAFSVA